MRTNPVLRIASKIMIPVILLFGLYVLFHGDFGPGGGFQAGVIFSAGIILYGIVFGLDALYQLIPTHILRWLMSAGLLLFGGIGVMTLLLGGDFLDYNQLAADPVQGQHLGIFLAELGIGISVAAVMVTDFIAFADQSKRQ